PGSLNGTILSVTSPFSRLHRNFCPADQSERKGPHGALEGGKNPQHRGISNGKLTIMEGDRDMYRQFQDWCLKTYGDSGKTKTVTRRKYDRIVQLLNGSESSATDNAKFKFWVKSKGFQLGNSDEVNNEGKQVLYVPVKT
uniref:Nucleolar protein 4 n=1 Tax=Latimeria chalumnae TaxID=7897 RepID=H3B6S0_LATCH